MSAEDAFRLHDTFGFPYEMTKELLAEEALAVDDQGFEELMEQARETSRAGGAGASAAPAAACRRATSRCCASRARPAFAPTSWATRRPRPRAWSAPPSA